MYIDASYIEKKILKNFLFTPKELSYYLNLNVIAKISDLRQLNALLKLNEFIFKRKKIGKKNFKNVEKSLLIQLKKALKYKLR